jgi:hypothetical protein
MYAPFTDMYSESFGNYTLQLSAYQIPLEDIGLKVIARRIVWLKDDGTYELIPTKDVTKELWGGGTRTYNYILLYCEHGYQPISVHTTWDHGNSTMIHHASTKYFSCKEAAEQWLKGLKGYRERIIERAKYLIEKETKILSKYKFND